jgi:regulator of nucleoside diphosphate kinase
LRLQWKLLVKGIRMQTAPPITVSSLDLERIEELIASDAHRKMPGIDALKDELDRANVIEPHEIPHGLVTMNSTVFFRDEQTSQEYELTLAYPGSDAQPNPVSILAPVGSALLGLSIGQSITWQVPGGRQLELRVLDVRFQPEANGQFHR